MIEKSFLDKVKNFFTVGSGNFVASSISAIFWLYIASLMDQSEYGMLGFFISIATIAHAVSTLGLNRTIVVYEAKKENILSAAYTLGLISSSLTSIVVFVITQNISLSFLIWGMMIFLLKTSELNSKKLYSNFAKFRILRSILILILGISLFQIFGINGVILGFALSTLPALGGLYNYAKSKKVSMAVLKPKAKFMVTSWLTTLADLFYLWGDKIMIGSMLGFSVLGSYHLAFQYLLLLNTVPRAIFIYLLPQESEGKQNKKIKFFVVGVSCILTLISILMVPYAIDTLLPDYHESILPAQILSISIIPITIYAIFESKFIGREMPKIALIGTGMQTIIYFSLMILLAVDFGIIGIAIGFLVSTVARAIYSATVSLKYL